MSQRQLDKALALGTMYGMGTSHMHMAAEQSQQRGTPAQLMQAHLRNLLARLRLTVPFEVDGTELINACLPEAVWTDDVRWQNVRDAMKMEHTTFFQLTHGKQEVGAMDGIFWYRYEEDLVPVPHESMAALVVPCDVPFLKKLYDWMAKATIMDEAITAATKLVTGYAGAMKHPDNIRNRWPDLWPFVTNVGSANKTFNKNVPVIPPHLAVSARIDPPLQRKITDMLTTATLLPDKQPVAWVGFHK